LPAKDVPVLLAALGAGADFLLTGDKKHFRHYFDTQVAGLTIMKPKPFLSKYS